MPDNIDQQDDYEFLTLDDVLYLHERGIDLYSPGESKQVRDQGLLESAVFNPQQTFGGDFLYPSLIDMASATWSVSVRIMHLLTATNGSLTWPAMPFCSSTE